MMNTPTTILFAGYAPVHFVCFQPIYEALKRSPQFSVRLSGSTMPALSYDASALHNKSPDRRIRRGHANPALSQL